MMNTAYALIFGFVITVGLPLNAVSLWILLRHHSLKLPSAVFMVNLAISDLLLIVSLPMRVYYYAKGTWTFSNMTCIWVTMLFRNNIRSSSIFITFISVDRLLAVVYPLRSRHLRTSSKAWKGAALVWLIVLVVNVPESVGFLRHLSTLQNSTCFEFDAENDTSLLQNETLTMATDYFQLVLLFAMLAVNIVSTAMVLWTVQRHQNESALVKNKVNVMLIFIMNLMMFTVFFLPVSLVVFFENFRPALSCLASLNCCLDPLLYYFSFDGFWKRKEEVDMSLGRE
ncbi:lysophosphatidic acid receptor 6-like [Odontesthes bonariensis]|uniref:lysophosphatidic acid receptor 6-like n=1 Tax=Odontesthes bonariensis TaxID=219752 RepID=UPI003F58494D